MSVAESEAMSSCFSAANQAVAPLILPSVGEPQSDDEDRDAPTIVYGPIAVVACFRS